MQWKRPRAPAAGGLHRTHREDLIGYGKGCLLRPNGPAKPGRIPPAGGRPAPAKGKAQPTAPAPQGGWPCFKKKPGVAGRRKKNGAQTLAASDARGF